MRLDVVLAEKMGVGTRTKAQNLIKMQLVKVNGNVITKCGYEVDDSDAIEVLSDYSASLGSYKLLKAIDEFKPNIENKVCLDLGASNGGFTDVLLKNNAKRVYALDIGPCALPEYLKNDSRVTVKDNTNARYVTKKDFDENIDFIVIDLSFISLKLILPTAYAVLKKDGYIIALIKPQFELEKNKLTKSGIVKSDKLRETAKEGIIEFALALGFTVSGVTETPRLFDNKNVEYLVYLKK